MTKIRDIFNYIIALCLFAASLVVLAVSSFTTIYYDMGSENDWPHYGKENILLLVVLLAAVMGLFFFLYKGKVFEKYSRQLMLGGLLFVLFYCLLLILVIVPQAVNDSKTLDDIINEFVAGNYSSLTQPGGYLFTWPFQLGYVGFGQIMALVFGPSNYFAWDMLQMICILVTVFLIYRITRELFEDETVCGIAALLSCGALFFYNYVTYIYGDIISMAPQTLALYMMILFVKRDKVRYALISALSIAAAVLIKTNCEVTLIALVMVLIVSSIPASDGVQKKMPGKKTLTRLLLAALFVAVTMIFKSAVNTYYCGLTGLSSIPEGNPAWAHIAMGLQESDLEDGWYNGYNYHVFEENGYDSKATAIAARDNISNTLESFVKNPVRGLRFFARKFATQWADSVCISTHNLDLVSRHVDKNSAFRDYLVFGSDKGCPVLIWIMNVFMPVCYMGVAIYLFALLKGRKASPQEMLLLILIFGGIVFHEFWEGSSRYVMRYYIYWLPYAAYGIGRLLEGLKTSRIKNHG